MQVWSDCQLILSKHGARPCGLPRYWKDLTGDQQISPWNQRSGWGVSHAGKIVRTAKTISIFLCQNILNQTTKDVLLSQRCNHPGRGEGSVNKIQIIDSIWKQHDIDTQNRRWSYLFQLHILQRTHELEALQEYRAVDRSKSLQLHSVCLGKGQEGTHEDSKWKIEAEQSNLVQIAHQS